MRPFYLVCYAGAQLLCRLAFRLTVSGREHIPASGPFIVASNHLAYFDPMIVGCILKREICYLARAELFEQFFVKDLIRHLNAFPVHRGQSDITSLKTCITVLGKKKMPLLMFPEGTRIRTGELGVPQRGIAFIAAQTKVPILPVYVENSDRLGDCLRRKKRLKVRLGAALSFAHYRQLTDDKRYRDLAQLVMAEIQRLKEESREETRA